MADIKPAELDDIQFAFDVYASGSPLDASKLGDVLRALNLNPSLEKLEKFGATKKLGEKTFKFDEFLPIYSQCKKDIKDQGCYEDFLELLKLYDKAENGKMQLGELSHSLLALAEKLTDDEVDELFEDCMDEEDDEGEIYYDPFLRRMCDKEPPLVKKKK